MPELTATDYYQMLRVIWPKWRSVATSTRNTDRARAEVAIQRFYQFYQLPVPTIAWVDSVHRLPSSHVGMPIISHCRETLIYAVWHKLCNPAWVCSQIGYDPLSGVFRLADNKRLLMSRAYITPRRPGRRPEWLINASNLLTQFDADVLALFALAEQSGITIEPRIGELATIMGEIVQSCFGAMIFEETCLLFMKPHTVVLNPSYQIAAQGTVAFESHGDSEFRLYATNGRIISRNTRPKIDADRLNSSSPSARVALIEYMGWEDFLKLMLDRQQTQLVHRDKYGILFLIRCGWQEFMVVKVQNKTPERNGRYRDYVIPVDRECRPLPDPHNPRSRFGMAQTLTALNAVGSTFGMTGERYAAILDKET